MRGAVANGWTEGTTPRAVVAVLAVNFKRANELGLNVPTSVEIRTDHKVN